MFIFLGFVVWVALGFLGSRLVKHYFITAYGETLGPRAWTRHDERQSYLYSLAGLSGLLATLVFLRFCTSRDVPWGIKW